MANNKNIDLTNESELARIQRIIDFSHKGKLPNSIYIKGENMLSDRANKVIGSRTIPSEDKGWSSFEDRTKKYEGTDGKIIDPERENSSAARTKDYIGSYYNWNGPLGPEYLMQEPISIFDTESYLKQTINRRLSLMFRNGFEVVGRDRDVNYINHRISTMEYVSNRTFRALMKKIMFSLFLQANCFLLKIRKEGASGVSSKPDQPIPVSSYTIIPAHQIQPVMKKGIIHKWRRFYDTGRHYDDYAPSEIVHFKLDQKSWHIFGTPRTIAVRDDIFALRRLEENTELLFINYLFPLFHVKVGNELNPATYTMDGTSEVELVKYQIENMPKEGVFVTDERTEVTIVGAQKEVLDFMGLLQYYRARVFAGLGMSELDMGSSTHGGSALSDNISQNLKDSIKADVEEFADQVKMYIFKEWLLEANYTLSVQNALEELQLTFHEIDLDSRIKEENHVLNLYNNNLITSVEARKRIRMRPHIDQQDLHVNRDTAWLAKITTDLQTNSQITILKAQKSLGIAGHNEVTKKVANGKTKMTKTMTTKTAPKSAAVQNIVTPINQHGAKLGPKKMSDRLLESLKDKLIPACNILATYPDSDWKSCSADIIDSIFTEFNTMHLDDSEEYSYTKHLQEEITNLKELVAVTDSSEELEIILDDYLATDTQDIINED